jgi:hypothetical protein
MKMEKIKPEQAVKELTLLLMYLTRFKEVGRASMDLDLDQAWKGYDFDTINELADENLIWQGSRRSKSVSITEEGKKQARELLARYQIADWEKFK